VNIYGTEYPIKGDMDTDYIEAVAKYVDSKMREIDKSGNLKSALRVAILAALNIADELFKERTTKEQMLAELEIRTKSLAAVLDEGLGSY
jgi:cell division protein ZapA